tara:strand:+ start:107 stop:400 length:294 start_codon:yes stop_codon:yes gene_type:complete
MANGRMALLGFFLAEILSANSSRADFGRLAFIAAPHNCKHCLASSVMFSACTQHRRFLEWTVSVVNKFLLMSDAAKVMFFDFNESRIAIETVEPSGM